ncbi:MAG TPA: hypothetical protein VKS43_08010 [Burkholderiales bacterium]|nr:hypothetical protein [Burkholderiales bacterium]
MMADYMRGASGSGACAGLIFLVKPAPAVAMTLGAAALLFLVYFARTVCRQLTHIELDETGIRALGPLGAPIRWEDLRALRLDYYSTRGDREGGWMQLRLRDARRTIRIDSEVDGFAELAAAAAAEARRRGADLDLSTRANLELLGIAGPAAGAG